MLARPFSVAHRYPEAPLASWLSADELARVHAVADDLEVAREVLAPFRPWLAGQMLKLASQSRRGMSYDTSPEDVFRSRADRAGIPVYTEFESTESLVQLFTKSPPVTGSRHGLPVGI